MHLKRRHIVGILFLLITNAPSAVLALDEQLFAGELASVDTRQAENKRKDFKPKDRGWYIGFSLGYADDKGLDDSSDGLKVFGGYRFNKYLALEGAVIDLGEDLGPGDFSKFGLAVQAVGILPVSQRVELLGKVGFFDWEITAPSGVFECFSFSGGFSCFEEDRTVDEGTEPVYGVGLNYNFGKRWSLRAEWERFTNVGRDDVDMISIGTYYRF
jgi:OmpA-OmpF porin, OOP family